MSEGTQGAQDQSTQANVNSMATIVAVGEWIIEQNKDFSFTTWGSDRMFAGVTNVKRWVNETDQEVRVWKVDGGYSYKDEYTIPAGHTVNAHMWIPWADQPGTGPLRYDDHHAVIMVGGQPLAYLWQSGTLIRFNTSDAFVNGGVAVPGLSRSGGDKTMVIGKDPQSRVGFALGMYKR